MVPQEIRTAAVVTEHISIGIAIATTILSSQASQTFFDILDFARDHPTGGKWDQVVQPQLDLLIGEMNHLNMVTAGSFIIGMIALGTYLLSFQESKTTTWPTSAN